MNLIHTLSWLTYTLIVIGAINWGLVGLADFNLVTQILGDYPQMVNLVYILVGASGVIHPLLHPVKLT